MKKISVALWLVASHAAFAMEPPEEELYKLAKDFKRGIQSGEIDFGILPGTLVHAAGSGNVQELAELIQASAQLEQRDKAGWTPLHWAAVQGERQSVLTLAHANADLNAQTNSKETPLILAIKGKQREIACNLIEIKADPNKTDAGGFSALTWAAYQGARKLVQKLCDHGANVAQIDKAGYSIWSRAYQKGRKKTCQLLDYYLIKLSHRQLGPPDFRCDYEEHKNDLKKQLFQDIREKNNHFVAYFLHFHPEAVHWKIDQQISSHYVKELTPGFYALGFNNIFAALEVDRVKRKIRNEPTSCKAGNPPAEFLTEMMETEDSFSRVFEIVAINDDLPLSDDLLLSLNPRWRNNKKLLSQDQKNQILKLVSDGNTMRCWRQFYIRGKEPSRLFPRTLLALTACVGADLDKTDPDSINALYFCIKENDYHLARYLLEKKITILEDALNLCNTIKFAQLLLKYNAPIPHNLMETICMKTYYPPELVEFYLNRRLAPYRIIGIEPNMTYEPLILAIGSSSQYPDCKINKIRLLLNLMLKSDIDLCRKNPFNRNFTLLHELADKGHKETCQEIVNHFMLPHKGFVQFLCFLRKNYSTLYGLLKQYESFRTHFNEAASYQRRLVKLLSIQDTIGACAWNRCKTEHEVDVLHPDSYKLKKPSVELVPAGKVKGRVMGQKGSGGDGDGTCICF